MQKLRYTFHFIFILYSLYFKINAQNAAFNLDFEYSPASIITSSNQLSAWKIQHGISYDNCNLSNCCALPPNGSELIIAPTGYTDNLIGSVYPIFSVFGDSIGDPTGTTLNPQLNRSLTGNSFLRLNKPNGTAGNQTESLTRIILVSDTVNVIDVAYMIVAYGQHNCCESPGFKMTISSSTCSIDFSSACPNINTNPSFYSIGTGISNTNGAGIVFSKWQIKRFDLNSYIGQTVTLTINASGCTLNGHLGYAYVDAKASASTFTVNNKPVIGGVVTLPHCTTSVQVFAPHHYKSYQWQGPGGFSSTSSSIVAKASGVYTLNLDMAYPCDATSKTISINFLPTPAINSFTSEICPGKTATLTASGSINYLWLHNASTATSLVVSPAASTVYSVLCTDTSNCVTTAIYTLSILNTPTLVISKLSNVCVGDNVELLANGAITYSWKGSNGYSVNLPKTSFRADSIPTIISFTITGTDANSCTNTATYSFQTYPKPNASIKILPTSTICLGNSLSFSASGGGDYEWRGPLNFYSTEKKFQFVPNSINQIGMYTLCATDAHGCRGFNSQQIFLNPLPYGQLIGNVNGCVPLHSDFEFVESTENKSKLINSHWKVGNKTYTTKTFSYLFSTPGKYMIEGWMVDSNSCVNTHSTYVNVYPTPTANFTYLPQKPIENLDEVFFTNTSRGEQQAEWQWYFSEDATTKLEEKHAERLYNNPGKYTVSLVVKNDWYCADTITKVIDVEPNFFIHVPNSFTPNEDGLNDIFVPVSRGVKFYTLMIFNRWGTKIFESTDTKLGWDGSYKGESCKSDIYIWKIYVSSIHGEEKVLTGEINLYR